MHRLSPILLVASLLLPACAHAAPRRPSPGNSFLERALIEDAADRRFQKLGLLDAALVASGVNTTAALERHRAWLHARIDPIVKRLPRPPAARGRALLGALHQPQGGPALLRGYDAEATTLLDIVESGRFNCVSATVLYLVAAERAGLTAHPVLMPLHARAEVEVPGGRIAVVETTSPRGFDPPPAALAEISRRVRPARSDGAIDLYSDERGARVDFSALLGSMSSNLAVQARGRGDLAAVDAFDRRAEALATAEAATLVRRLRASTLSELGMRALGERRLLEGLALFEQAARIARGSPHEPLFLQNLVAVGQQRVDELVRTEDEAKVLGFADRFGEWPEVRREVLSFAYQKAGLRRGEQGDHEGMARMMREAAALGGKSAAGAARNLEVAEHNAAAQRLNEDAAKLQGLQALADSDPEAAWARFNALPVPTEAKLRRFRRGVGAYVAAKRAERALKSGEDCARVDAAVADWLALLDGVSESPGQIRAACRSRMANAHFAAGRFAEALPLHREAQRLAPGDPAHVQNVVACLGNLANAHARAGRCDRARPLLEEARRLAPRDAGLAELQRQCLGR